MFFSNQYKSGIYEFTECFVKHHSQCKRGWRNCAGLAAIGAGIGIGQIGKGAVESIARQPEALNDIRANMILTAALVEGAALFGIIVGFLAMVL